MTQKWLRLYRNMGRIYESNKFSEFVEAVERSNFVGFGQRRVVEYRVAEIFDGRAHRKHDLPDMHDLGGSIADE